LNDLGSTSETVYEGRRGCSRSGRFGTSGNAQNVYQDKFTLPFETHWGSATLPAGDYTFTMSFASSSYMLYIRGEKVNAIIMATAADEQVASGHAQLNG